MYSARLTVMALSLMLACPVSYAQSTTSGSGPGNGAPMMGPPGSGMQGQAGPGGQGERPHGPPPNVTKAIQLLDEAKQKETSSDVLNLITEAETLLKQPPPRRPGGQGQGEGQGQDAGGPPGNTTGGFQQR